MAPRCAPRCVMKCASRLSPPCDEDLQASLALSHEMTSTKDSIFPKGPYWSRTSGTYLVILGCYFSCLNVSAGRSHSHRMGRTTRTHSPRNGFSLQTAKTCPPTLLYGRSVSRAGKCRHVVDCLGYNLTTIRILLVYARGGTWRKTPCLSSSPRFWPCSISACPTAWS